MEHINRTSSMVISEPFSLIGDAKVWETVAATLELGKIAQNSKPTIVARGISKGYSLPVFNSDDEELFMCICTPRTWDGTTDPYIVVTGYIDTANTDKKFKLQVSWTYYNPNTDVAPDTSTDVEIEVDTGTAVQYQAFVLKFTVNYDVNGAGNEMLFHNRMAIRVRRIAASVDEIAGEFVVAPPFVRFLTDKI